MWKSIANFFNSAKKRLKRVWGRIIKGAFGYFMASVLDFAKEVVKSLEIEDLTNDKKREKAFNTIMKEGMRLGLFYKNNWINIIINIALGIVREEF